MDFHPPNGSTRPSYKTKLGEMRKLVRRYVTLNAALCDQVSETQEQLVIAKENRRFLLERLQRLSSAQQESVPQAPPKAASLSLSNVYPSSSQGSSMSVQEEEEDIIPMPLPLAISLPFSLPTPEPMSQPKKKPKPKRSTLMKTTTPSDVFRTASATGPTGSSIFPLTLRGLTVFSVGVAKDYETKEVNGVELLIPRDFQSMRIYGSLSDPEKRCRYDCRVHTRATQSRTHYQCFEIRCQELDIPLRAPTADSCHANLLRLINDSLGAQVTTQLPKGEWFFGYGLPAVRKHMNTSVTAQLLDAEGCIIDEENDDTLHFEALQRSIAVARFETQADVNISRVDQTSTSVRWEM